VRERPRLLAASAFGVLVALLQGCQGQGPAQGLPNAGGGSEANRPLSAEESKASQELNSGLSKIINDATSHYRPLDYEYNEDLLVMLDRIETYLSGKSEGKPLRVMKRLDEQEEADHLRETVKRWTQQTGKDLRAEIDKLKAEVAARKPGGSPFHPEFQKHFSAAFDDLIPIEVAEIRERRNREIHRNAKSLFDQYRSAYPELVRQQEAFLNQPPYNLPPPTNASK
jgi:hypothetical protein